MKSPKNHSATLKLKIATNLVLGALILSVGALCLSPADSEVTAGKAQDNLYRSAGEEGKGVSLMFNVYWGTEEVYRILDILEENGAKATFFIGGCWADDNVDCLRAIAAKGHELGNHGYFHKDHSKLNLEQNKQEISSCNRFIELSVGKAPTLFAPPSGAYGEPMLAACQSLHMQTILWSKDTVDWRDKNAALIYTRATKEVKIGDFILLHPMKETADALGNIVNYYQKHSLKTVTVSENLGVV